MSRVILQRFSKTHKMFKFYSTKKKKENVGVSYGFGILIMTISKIGIHFDEKRLGV
jgi:hypothetical protein